MAGVVVDGIRYGLLDVSTVGVLTSAMSWAAIGWLLGSGIGLVFARRRPPMGGAHARVVRGLAAVALLLGVAMARFESSRVMPGGWGQQNLPGLQRATVVDAALVALILVVAAGIRRTSQSQQDASGAVVLGISGLVLACLALPLAIYFALAQPSGADRVVLQRQNRANSSAVGMLTSAVHAYYVKHGSYPPDVSSMAIIAKLPPGTAVASAGPTLVGTFCVQIGADAGGGRAGPPYYWGSTDAHGNGSMGRSPAC